MTTISLCYATENENLAQKVRLILPHDVHVSLSPQLSKDAIQIGIYIEQIDYVVLIWSPQAAMSPAFMDQAKIWFNAWSKGKLIIIRYDAAELPIGLRDVYCFDYSEEQSEGLRKAIAEKLTEVTIDIDRADLPSAVGGAAAGAAAGSLIRGIGTVVGGVIGAVFGGVAVSSTKGGVPTADAGEHVVFVSYSHSDINDVDPIVSQIEEAGYNVWIDRKAKMGSGRYAAQIVKAIKSAKVVTLMASKSSINSDHVIREVYVAGDFNKPFLVCKLDDVDLPDEVLYFISGFPRVSVSEKQRIIMEISRFLSVDG
jgi:hypothetical protein